MKISVFGASGFLGYDFVRLAVESGLGTEITAYSTNAGSLANISRHDMEIRLVNYTGFPDLELDSDTEFLVNFSHPFADREDLSTHKQISSLLKLFRRQMDSNPRLKLIQISSMSVYEPFASEHEFDEDSVINPPKSDVYAKDKADIDKELLSWKSHQDRILLLRPTVVYGPFCKPWSDNILKQFLGGEVFHLGLSGKIQPIWGSDVTRIVLANLEGFRSGVLNLAGPEIMSWKSFFAFFQNVVEEGELIQLPVSDTPKRKKDSIIRSAGKKMIARLVKIRAIKELIRPFWQRIPEPVRQQIKQQILGTGSPSLGPYCREFFQEDRLVSLEKFERSYPDFSLTPISDVRSVMKTYCEFRFSNGPFWHTL